MLLSFNTVRTVLCLGAHADDIEIGCGGTLLTLAADQPGIEVHWVVLSGDERRKNEAQASCAVFCREAARHRFVCRDFRDSFFPYDGPALKEYFHELAGQVRPDLIFTHHRHDMHQDHRVVAELTWNAFRDHAILEYEIPKWEGDLGKPSVFVPLSAAVAEQKISALLELFPSQRDRPWFDRETFLALLRLRGLEAKSPSRYAEAFHARKLVLTRSAPL